jgi:hypothetical protein
LRFFATLAPPEHCLLAIISTWLAIFILYYGSKERIDDILTDAAFTPRGFQLWQLLAAQGQRYEQFRGMF